MVIGTDCWDSCTSAYKKEKMGAGDSEIDYYDSVYLLNIRPAIRFQRPRILCSLESNVAVDGRDTCGTHYVVSEAEMNPEIIAGFISAVAIIVTLITALNTTRSNAFSDLQKVVDALQKRSDKSELRIEMIEKELAHANEYIKILITQLISHGIIPTEQKTDL